MKVAVSRELNSMDHKKPLRIAAVSYLNARPLIYGLDSWQDCELQLDVPAKLIDVLRDGLADVALLPVIDYQHLDNLRIVTAGGIGCDGETLTVRIFSKVPIEHIQTLACDPESHTSVALAKIVLAEQFGIEPDFMEMSKSGSPDGPKSDALLLIGDKVVCEEPAGYEHQLDLGAAWKQLTGLPFVFAVWTARSKIDLGDLPHQLEHAKRDGLAHASEIVAQYATPRGWPADVALQYLTNYLRYDIGEPQLEAIRQFHELAARHRLIRSVRPLRMYVSKRPR